MLQCELLAFRCICQCCHLILLETENKLSIVSERAPIFRDVDDDATRERFVAKWERKIREAYEKKTRQQVLLWPLANTKENIFIWHHLFCFPTMLVVR